MSAPIVYKSTDGNAPVLRGERTSLIEVLTACLVTGYGAQPAAGWTRPFSNVANPRAWFRNNPAIGTGYFPAVDQASPASAFQAALTAYEIMTSESAGSFPIGSTGNASISATANTTARPWILIATDTYVYFFSHYNVTLVPNKATMLSASATTAGLCFFFGDFIKASGSDGYSSLFAWSGVGSAGFGQSDVVSTPSRGQHFVARGSSGVSGAIAVAINTAPPSGGGSSTFGSLGPGYMGLSGLIVSKAIVNDGIINSLRGYLPAFLVPCHPYPFENWGIVPIDGSDYLSVMWKVYANTSSIYVAQALISLSGVV